MNAAAILAALQEAASATAIGGVNVKSVRLAATAQPAHPAIMVITWSMPELASIERAGPLPGIHESVIERPQDLAIPMERAGATVHDIESAALGAAWHLGAWDVRRTENAPLHDPGQWDADRYGLPPDFGRCGYRIGERALVRGTGADDHVLQYAARHGWITWIFIPLALATPLARARWGKKDTTLDAACQRSQSMPGIRRADLHRMQPGYGHEHIYQLGRANHGNRSRVNQSRRA